MTESKWFDHSVARRGYSTTNNSESMNDAFAYCRHLGNARSFVEKHPNAAVKLTDVANAIGVSPSRLSHLFRETIGMSFTEWLTHKRIEKAMEMLRHRDIAILNLAHWSGFGSYRSFHRSFKKITGTTPFNYKKEQRMQFLAHSRQDSTHP